MVTSIEHRKEFIIDTEKILDRLKDLLLSSELSIPKIYREIHSLKGAAGFAGLSNMEQLAHAFESFLANIRDGKISLDDDIEKIFYQLQDYFVKDINLWKSESRELSIDDLLQSIDLKTSIIKPLSIEVIEDYETSVRFFSEFEETLLKEAMYRGEQFYRIICHIDRDEEMKYPRLFLVVNNLETISNVIKIYPPMDDIVKNKSKEITLYLTTDQNKGYIYKGLSFDRIREVEFQRLEYSSFIDQKTGNSIKKSENLYGSSIDVETCKIEELFNYSQDLYNKLLLEDLVVPNKKSDVEKLLEGLKESLTSLTTISFNKAFSFFESYCNKLAEELGKQIKFSIIGGEISIDRQLAEILKEIFIQLVKNSIDHGIESKDIRLQAGKNPIGTINLKVSTVNGSLAITLIDDGKGVDRKHIVTKAVEGNYIENGEQLSLLSLISKAGFSTSKEVNYYSGRGIGLNIVVNRIVNKLDGKIKVENRPGESLAFHMLIPPSSSVKKYTLFKYRKNTFAFSMVNVVEKVSIDSSSITIGDSSTLNYNHNGDQYPIYTPWGRLSSSKPLLDENYGFILRYLGKKAFFPVDEFVLEKELLSSVVKYIDTDTPTHKQVFSSNKKEDFILITPSIING